MASDKIMPPNHLWTVGQINVGITNLPFRSIPLEFG